MGEVAGWDLLATLAVAAVALAAATPSGVTGFGGAVVLLPVLVWTVGPLLAISILTVAQLYGNLARVGFNRREVDWRVAGRFCLGAAGEGARPLPAGLRRLPLAPARPTSAA